MLNTKRERGIEADVPPASHGGWIWIPIALDDEEAGIQPL